MTYLKDWYDFISSEQKEDLAKEYLAGPKRLNKFGEFWGTFYVSCTGTEIQAMNESKRLFKNKYENIQPPYSKMKEGYLYPKTVLQRLKEEGYLK